MNISVCIATYNGAKYIKPQLMSILKQLGDDDEVIISDDSSTDETVEIIKQLNDSRIKLYTNMQFRSPILNFEHAISKATGDYIFLADQDDEWDPAKVNTLLPLMQQKILAASYFTFIDSNSTNIVDNVKNLPHKSFIYNFIKPSIPGCCMAFRSEFKSRILPFPKGIAMHDWWITLVAAMHNQIAITQKPLVRIRRHETNYSTTGSKSKFSLKQKLAIRFSILKQVFTNLYALKRHK